MMNHPEPTYMPRTVSRREYAVWTVGHSTARVKWFETEDEARTVAAQLSRRHNKFGRYDYSVTRYPVAGHAERLATYSDGAAV